MIPIPSIDYVSLAVLIASVIFFVRAARAEHRSTLAWGGMSVGTWFFFTGYVWGGMLGAIVSQVLLYAGLTLVEMHRERRRTTRGPARATVVPVDRTRARRS